VLSDFVIIIMTMIFKSVIRLHCYPGEPPFRAASRDSGSTGRSVFLGQGMSSI